MGVAAAVLVGGNDSPAWAAADSAALQAQALALIGDAACVDSDQCRTIEWGAKACGGPQAYVAWSTLRTDEAALKKAVAKFAASRRKEIERLGLASDCSLVADPGAACAPNPRGSANAPPRVCTLNARPSASRLVQAAVRASSMP